MTGVFYFLFLFLKKIKYKIILYLLEGLKLSTNKIFLHSNINIKLSTCRNDTNMSMEYFFFKHSVHIKTFSCPNVIKS